MQWLILFFAGILEVFWASFLRLSEGFTKPIPSIIAIVGNLASIYFLSLALKNLPLGSAYAIWVGIGVVGTFLVGIFAFHESVSIPQIICVTLILIGTIGMKLTGAAG